MAFVKHIQRFHAEEWKFPLEFVLSQSIGSSIYRGKKKYLYGPYSGYPLFRIHREVMTVGWIPETSLRKLLRHLYWTSHNYCWFSHGVVWLVLFIAEYSLVSFCNNSTLVKSARISWWSLLMLSHHRISIHESTLLLHIAFTLGPVSSQSFKPLKSQVCGNRSQMYSYASRIGFQTCTSATNSIALDLKFYLQHYSMDDPNVALIMLGNHNFRGSIILTWMPRFQSRSHASALDIA